MTTMADYAPEMRLFDDAGQRLYVTADERRQLRSRVYRIRSVLKQDNRILANCLHLSSGYRLGRLFASSAFSLLVPEDPLPLYV